MDKKELVQMIIDADEEILKDLLKSKFKGEHIRIAFTGALEHSRANVMMWLSRYLKVQATPHITKETTMIIVGERPGAKLERAKKMGIPIMTGEVFGKLVELSGEYI